MEDLMAYETLSLSVEGGIAHVQLSRGAAFNTMNKAFWPEMVAVFTEIEEDPTARVVVFSAQGKHFTSGLDLNDFGPGLMGTDSEPARKAEALRRSVLRMQETMSVVDRCRLPVLMAVQGACIGGGIDLISSADMRYCTEDAFFCIQETNIGMTADVGTLQRLPHIIPHGIVRELTYTGRRMMAAEARDCGLVNQVFADQEALLAAVMAIATEIAAKSPIATVGNKEMLNYARDHSIQDGLNYIATWNAAMLSRADLGEAFMAKAEKRETKYADLDPANKLA
ncbi:MAG: crotonase/enoyl-CoA hydratase family protein [Rhodospirillaceae bacterium]|jgi:enoyl-CoA hydratase|nr:crotonase/enoyl-CoA hydratase family protein [Rhodospirillaceae bacterium]MBT3495020.1 crotonase/enoyl-CoA hydratase family protein [Rhodospirillaceae bacterium]MBT3781769.1 crotonase/enoyl-CoA hydratase family protein [Rhodospirillaceae bacterium]MBT3979340.1 crotonase/enoyl-CoA hydratase family protein [Rhodospirillaceae bacterium]MBT4170651.1 crotonase/enoyl-CoA hydratase family protein [Rhodospirillaceae bacterium]